MERTFSQKEFARLIQRTLLAGVFLCVFLIFTGVAFTALGSPWGAALLRGAVLALIVTPAARVAMLIYGYLRGGETYFALASFVVLALLGLSILV